MKLFLSHSSNDKALVREFARSFPGYFQPWLDERELIAGTPIAQTIDTVISKDVFYLVLFVSKKSQESEWVKQEIKWAIEEKERQIGRPFVIPVLFDNIWESIEPSLLKEKKYIPCFTQDEVIVKAAASLLIEEITKLIVAYAEQSSHDFPITPAKITDAQKKDIVFMLKLSDIEHLNLKMQIEEEDSVLVISNGVWLFKLISKGRESFDIIYKDPSGIHTAALGNWNIVRQYFLEWTNDLRNAQQSHALGQ